MRTATGTFFAALLFFVSSCGGERTDEPVKERPEQPGPSAPPASHTFDPDQLSKNKGSVFVFLSPDCPLCQGYAPLLKKLSEQYLPDSILFYAVFSGKTYSEQEISKFSREYDLHITCFVDKDYSLMDFLKASVTPEAFLVDRAGHVQYSGRIDNWAYDIGRKRNAATEHDLADALDAFNAGKEIKVKSAPAIGCVIEKIK